MDATHRGIITLLKSAITGQKYALPEDFDLETVCNLSKAHHMHAMIYMGAVHCGVSPQQPVMKALHRAYCKALVVHERQMYQLQRVYDAFEQHHMEYMPLKGSVMKAMYPRPEMRMMGDADILIHREDREQLATIMQSLGFKHAETNDYDDIWQGDGLCVELHYLLISPKRSDMHTYFGSGWDFARQNSGCRYAMSAEDTFIYIFAHFVKHFTAAGIGCRHVVDLWVYLRQHPDLNLDYIRKQTDRIRLSSFLYNILKLLNVWFDDAPSDDVTDCMTEYIMVNGSWGRLSNYLMSMGLQDEAKHPAVFGVRGSVVLRWLYPGADTLRVEYPLLHRFPWLLPVIVPIRLARKLCTRSIVQQRGRSFMTLNRKKICNHRDMLAMFGLEKIP